MTSPASPLFVMLEGVLWIPGAEWRQALDAVAHRFRRVRVLDATTLYDIPVDAAMEQLHEWAGDAIDLGRELERFFDEHASIHIRPDPQLRRGIAALAQHRPIHVVSSLPESAAVAVLRHLGLARSCTVTMHDVDHDTILSAPHGRHDLIQQFTSLA